MERLLHHAARSRGHRRPDTGKDGVMADDALHSNLLALLEKVCTVEPRPDLSLYALKLAVAIGVVRNADEKTIWRRKGTAASLKALATLIKHLDAVEKDFGDVPVEGHEAIIRALGGITNKKTLTLRAAGPGQAAVEMPMDIDPAKEMASKVADIARVVRTAHADLAQGEFVPSTRRPNKDAVFPLTKGAANLFEWIAQTPATRSSYNAHKETSKPSPFELFLAAIFKCGGVTASPADQARKLMVERKALEKNPPPEAK
jgi:hypothetical protein